MLPKRFSITTLADQSERVWREIQVSSWKRHNKGLICKLDGIDVREDALALTNVEIGVAADLLPALPEGEFYWRDLIGCSVVTTKGYDLGKVTELMETGSNDVLVVEANVKMPLVRRSG